MMNGFEQAVVFGAGAVGSYLGARLPVPTVLVGRADHVRAIGESGLRITGREEALVRVAAAESCPDPGPRALVLVGVKHGDLERAAATLRPLLRDDTTVVVLANGLRPDAALGDMLARPVTRIIVQLGVTLDEPGRISFWGGGLLLGPGGLEDRLAQLFEAGGVTVERCDDLLLASWRKLAMNCVANPLSLLTGRCNRELVAPDLEHLRREIVAEIARLAAAEGVALPADTGERIDRALGRSGNRTSMLQDGLRGRSTEIEYLNGWVATRSEEQGLAAPYNRLLTDLVRLWLASRSTPGVNPPAA